MKVHATCSQGDDVVMQEPCEGGEIIGSGATKLDSSNACRPFFSTSISTSSNFLEPAMSP
jgi:hypothetical protein